jgi:hypothetical protein
MDKRFEEHQAENNRRFDHLETTMQSGFSQLTSILNSIQAQIGKPFEQFARNVIVRILKGEGIDKIKIEPKTFIDTQHLVFKESNEIEIDGFSENPPVIMEITSILKDTAKVEKFLNKKQFIEKYYNRGFRGFFVAAGTEIDEETKLDIIYRLRTQQCELINL